MADETPDLSPAEVAAAKAEFLASPPEILDPNEPAAPVVDDAAEEAAAIAELTKPPAAPEGATTSPPAPAPATSGPPPGADPYATFGGYEAVRNAFAVQEALRTEQGLRTLVAQGLSELGYDPVQISNALRSAEAGEVEPPPTNDPFAGLDDEDTVTVAQTRALLQQVAEQAAAAAVAQTQQQVQPIQEVIERQQQQQVSNLTDSTVIEVLGPVPYDQPDALAAYQRQVDAIVERAQRYYDPNQWSNPVHIRQTVIQANAEIQAEQESRFQDYLAKRKAVRDSQPVNIGGGAGSEGPLPEPKNLDDARKQLASQGFFS